MFGSGVRIDFSVELCSKIVPPTYKHVGPVSETLGPLRQSSETKNITVSCALIVPSLNPQPSNLMLNRRKSWRSRLRQKTVRKSKGIRIFTQVRRILLLKRQLRGEVNLRCCIACHHRRIHCHDLLGTHPGRSRAQAEVQGQATVMREMEKVVWAHCLGWQVSFDPPE